MAVSVSWKLLSGSGGSPVDLTSRLKGFSIDQQLVLNKQATFRASMQLSNMDGALTPGGGGAYASTDWFSVVFRLEAVVSDGTTTYQGIAFQGIVDTFDLLDTGIESVVNITMLDLWTVAGRMKLSSQPAFAQQNAETLLNNVTTAANYSGQWLQGYIAQVADQSMAHSRQVKSDTTVTNVTFADLMSSLVYPALNAWGWPGTLDTAVGIYMAAYFVTGSRALWNGVPPSFTFNQAASIAGTTLPFRDLKQGFNTGELINTATFKGLITGATEQTSQASNASTYGSRAVQFTRAATTSNAVSLDRAKELTGRYSTSQFLPQQVTLTGSMINRLCANAAAETVSNLLCIFRSASPASWTGPFLRRATITWTGKGAATQTKRCIILGRRITATATGDTTVTLNLSSWADNHGGFILNYDVLGEDRLG